MNGLGASDLSFFDPASLVAGATSGLVSVIPGVLNALNAKDLAKESGKVQLAQGKQDALASKNLVAAGVVVAGLLVAGFIVVKVMKNNSDKKPKGKE